MRLDKRALAEIIEILRSGLQEGTDVSQALREMDLEVDMTSGNVVLTEEYLTRKRH